MKIVFKSVLLLLLSTFLNSAYSGPNILEFETEVTFASWLFPESSLYKGQKDNNYSIALESELYAEWDEGDSFVFTPFILLDPA